MNENELRFKILKALEITNGRLTKGMLTSFLTSVIDKEERDFVLNKMIDEGDVKIYKYNYSSYYGKLLSITVIESK